LVGLIFLLLGTTLIAFGDRTTGQGYAVMGITVLLLALALSLKRSPRPASALGEPAFSTGVTGFLLKVLVVVALSIAAFFLVVVA
jgi:hypothetical protein